MLWQRCFWIIAILLLAQGLAVDSKLKRGQQANDFTGVKEKLGLFIWRIEDFSPVPWDTTKYGSFYTGDSYLILKTTKSNNKINRDLHFWLGNQTSQDEAGSSAILAVMLDHVLGGGAKQDREVQFGETPLFRSYFKQGLRYLDGGVKSGFNFVKDIKLHRRLFIVKGERNVQASQVPLDISSLNRFDSFILDCGKGEGVMVFRPRGTNAFEKIKATAVANDIKNEDHAGKGMVDIFDESENDDMTRFFTALGSGSLSQVSNTEIDDKSTDYKPKLFQISGSSCDLVKGPLNQDQFSSNSSYLLVAGPTGIFLWLGRFTSKQLRKSSEEAAKKYMLDNKLNQNTQVEQVLEGLETATFKQFFPVWKELIDTKGWRSILKKSSSRPTFSGPDKGSIKAVADWNVRDLHIRKQREMDKTATSPLGFLPDDGKGLKTIWRVENFNLVKLTDVYSFPAKPPVIKGNQQINKSSHQAFLYSGDSYVIVYHSGVGESIVYFWQGEKSSTDERGASALHAFRIDNEHAKGRAKQVRVEQGREPTHFLKMFGGTVVTLHGGQESGFRSRKNVNVHTTDAQQRTMLFRVMQVGKTGTEFRVEQVVETARNLDSGEVFLLISPRNSWIWRGKKSTNNEVKEAERIGRLISGKSLLVLEESKESQSFWSALGGKTPYASSSINTKTSSRLFTVSWLVSGSIRATEIFNFKQKDLNDRKVMMLDMNSVLYLWVGAKAKRSEQAKSEALAKLFLDTDPTSRNSNNTRIVICKRDAETKEFKNIFPSWKDGLWGFNFGG